MATLAVPGATTANTRALSTHGMPKSPRPDFPHRFSAERSPSPSFVSSFASPRSGPRSVGPMSPPMSARSFGTFIDSEPSTPAYSPRMKYGWDDSSVVLVRPMSTSSEPSTPTEPAWDMMMPVEASKPVGLLPLDRKEPFVSTQQQFFGTRLNPAPTRKAKAQQRKSRRTEVPKNFEVSRITKDDPRVEDDSEDDDGETKQREDHPVDDATAPLVKLASKVKFMLRRRSATNDKKKEKKEKDYYDPEEYLHWTER